MKFTQEHLYKFSHFHKAVVALSRDGEEPRMDHVFAAAAGLAEEQLSFCIEHRAALEAEARARGLIS